MFFLLFQFVSDIFFQYSLLILISFSEYQLPPYQVIISINIYIQLVRGVNSINPVEPEYKRLIWLAPKPHREIICKIIRIYYFFVHSNNCNMSICNCRKFLIIHTTFSKCAITSRSK